MNQIPNPKPNLKSARTIAPCARKESEEKQRREEMDAEQQRLAAQREARAAEDKAASERAAVERAAKAAAAREAEKYIAGIRTKVYGRVALPNDLQGNPEAEFMVSLLPGGDLENVIMRKSSGNPAYDAAVERAIRQAQPFTVPAGDEFQRNFRRFAMTFRPQR